MSVHRDEISKRAAIPASWGLRSLVPDSSVDSNVGAHLADPAPGHDQ
jgi:hypothetical protein